MLMEIKNLLRNVPILKRTVSRHRISQAAKCMDVMYLYPNDRSAILKDYEYANTNTWRGVEQILDVESAIRHVVANNIPGAFVECGVYTGGASAYALLSLQRNEPSGNRDYWGFDSFEGMPRPVELDGDYAFRWMYGKNDRSKGDGALTGSDVNLADYDTCLAFLKKTGYAESRIHLVKGWFQHTLPTSKAAIGPIAALRLDGDFYESTKVCLDNLYDLVAPGGVVMIDDYGGFEGCKRAVDEFLGARSIGVKFEYVDHSIRSFMKPY